MKKSFAAVLLAGLVITSQAQAGGGRYYPEREGQAAAIAAGVLGIIAGAINRPRDCCYGGPAYYEYGPYYPNPYNNPYPYYGGPRGYPGYPGPYLGPYPRYGGYGPGPEYYGRREYHRGRPRY